MIDFKEFRQDFEQVGGNRVYSNPRQEAVDFINQNGFKVINFTETDGDIFIVTVYFEQ
jgi:hypothetical protein